MNDQNRSRRKGDNSRPAGGGSHQFMFATGIENSYPTIKMPDGSIKRVDEMSKTDHYRRWKEDLELTLDLGIHYLRYGPPYYSTHTGPGQYNWDFADTTFAALQRMDITPIADLCHFGVPDWLENFQNPDFPAYFAEYAGSFAKRFPWVRLYTPINEISVAAKFSALFGWWNERLTSDKAFVTAIKHLCKANQLAQKSILEVQPHATFIQSESTEHYHPDEPQCSAHAQFLNERRFLALDLTYGYPVNVDIYTYLLDSGMTEDEYRWFGKNHVRSRSVMGNDYYVTNEHLVMKDGTTKPSGEIFGYYIITRQYYDRYHLPVMHTETNLQDAEKAPYWLWKEWANLHHLKLNGVPILGFTWYSLTDQVDWDTSLREDNGNVNPLGLYDLDRKIRPVGTSYKRLIQQWGQTLPTESFSLTITY